MTAYDELVKCSLFQDLAPRYLQILVPLPAQLTVKQGEYLFRESDIASQLYVIMAGRVVLQAQPTGSWQGEESLVDLTIVGPGEPVGLWALIPPYRRSFSAKALTDVTCISIDGKTMRERMEMYPEQGSLVVRRVVEILAQRLDHAHDVLADVKAQAA